MQLNITGRHFEVTDAIKQYAAKKLARITKFLNKPMDAHIILSVEKFRHIAEATLHVKNHRFAALEDSEDMYASLDKIFDSLKKQLSRYNERIRDRRRKLMFAKFVSPITRPFMRSANSDRQNKKDKNGIVEVKTFAAKPMTIEEATLELSSLNKDFFVFKNAETYKVNVIYRRKDGGFGLIEPEF